MQELSLSERARALVDDAARFAEESLAPQAGEIDARGEYPRTLIGALAGRGYLGATFPEEYGGLGLDPVAYGLLTEAIGKACCTSRALLTVQVSLIGETLLRWGSRQQIAEIVPKLARGELIGAFALSEPDVGSDARGVKTAYRKEGQRFCISGKKKWITFGGIADFLLVVARNEEVITAFLVPTTAPGVRVAPMRGLAVSRACHVAEIELDGVYVEGDAIIGSEGHGFTYVASTALDHGRYSIAWAGVAIAQAALEAMSAYACRRSQFGEKLQSHQLVRRHIANAVTRTHAARALCLRAGELRGRRSPEAIMETTIAKYFASTVAVQTALDAVQVHGGNGFVSDYPVERLLREAKLLEVIEGTSEMQQLMIGKYGVQRYGRSRGR